MIDLEPLRQDGYGMVPLRRPRPNVLVVRSQIDGTKQDLLVDTGWGTDGISLRTAEAVHLHSPGLKRSDVGMSATGKKVVIAERGRANLVRIGDVEITQVPLRYGAFKLMEGEGGVIGAGFLRRCSAILDLQNLKLYLRPPGKGHRAVIGPALQAAGLSEVPLLQGGDGDCYVDVEINGVASKMIVDTGAYLGVLDSAAASKLGVIEYKARLSSTDAAGVPKRGTLGRFRSFKISGTSMRVSDMEFSDSGMYSRSHNQVVGALGMDILGSNGAIIDFGQQKLYFYKSE